MGKPSHRSAFEGVRIARTLGKLVILIAVSCTEPAQREQLRIEIEADRAVQELVDEVSAVLEYATPDGGWQSLDSRRFEPKVRNPWPIEYRQAALGQRVNYQLTVTARDEGKSVVTTARAIREWDATGSLTLRVVLETECVRLKACANGQTCHDGACVDARFDASSVVASDEPAVDGGPGQAVGADQGAPVLAAEGDPCASDGERACTADEMSRAPLICEEGAWKPSQVCTKTELCDVTRGSQRGSCRAIAPECLGKQTNQRFCDSGVMRICTNMFESMPLECGDNEQCVSPQGEARCACKLGFADNNDGRGCVEPTSCETNNGGCDRLTTCSTNGSTRVCGACPAGYVGDGYSGCEPLLSNLGVSIGELAPPFAPDVHSYRLRVPLLAQRVGFTPTVSAEARIDLNGASSSPGQTWFTPTLQLGPYPVKLTLTSASGSTSTYDIVIEREGAQHAYLKASNTDAFDSLGMMIAIAGDTLVAGAAYEDSRHGGVDADQSDNSLENAGAVYVFSQRGDSWEQQAYLKASDPQHQARFGIAVAISGDTIVVGAMNAELIPTGAVEPRPGVAYVFTRTQGQWQQVARFSPGPGASSDWFGFNVAIEGDTIAVGAPRDGGSGSAYVYTRSGGEWREQQKLKATPPVSGASFGSAVAVSGDTLIVGAFEDGTEMAKAGSAYAFTRTGGVWAQTQRFTADPIAADASFGYSMAMSGDRLLIGAPRYASITTPVSTAPGEVFAFQRNATTWRQTQRMRAMLPRTSDSFGSAVAVSGETALIGSCGEASGDSKVGGDASRRDAPYAGAGYLFALEEGAWKLSAYLKAQHPDGLDSLGFGAALGADVAILSAIWESSSARSINGDQRNNDARNAGAVYVFQ